VRITPPPAGYHVGVLRAFAVLSALVVAVLAFAAGSAQAAGPSQTLRIVLHHDIAETERLPHYRAAAPIAVKVGGYAAGLPPLMVVAHGPGGVAVTAPLVRTGETFSGDLRLIAPGAWTVALSAKLGSVSAALANVPLDVVSEDAADRAVRLTFALAALFIATGLALVLRANGRPLAFAAIRKRS
jgi:hypothetical protein